MVTSLFHSQPGDTRPSQARAKNRLVGGDGLGGGGGGYEGEWVGGGRARTRLLIALRRWDKNCLARHKG